MRSANLTLRMASFADASRLHELHTMSVRNLCRGHYSAEVIDAWLANRGPKRYLAPIGRGDLFVVEDEGRMVGFGEAVSGRIVAVYVDPASVHRGVGTAIMDRALVIARRGHKGPIRLESTLNAEAFYGRFGFRVVKRLAVQRNGTNVPAVMMELAEG
jgi:GNAT superfamily N-acetyltransferase